MRALRPIFVLFTTVLFTTVLFITVGLLPAADDLQSVYAKIDQGAAGFKGLTADIRKVAHMDLINEDDIESGKITVKRAKPKDLKVRIDFTEPKQQQVVVDGNKAEAYYPNSNTLEEQNLGQYKDMVHQFLLLGFGSTSNDLRSAYNVRYEGQEAINGQPTSRIELIPKSADLAQTFPKIELWISNATGLALQQKLYEKGGKDYHLATYSNMKLRSDISDSEVKLNIPKGVTRTPSPIK